MMEKENFKTIGRYQIKKSLGKGGMGEVLLAYDPAVDRHVALKIIRSELLKYEKIRKRFLKEAKIAGKLTHPSIVPIYTIHQEGDELYYTMPYVEGETLKQIINKTKENEEKGEKPHPIGISIPSLIRIFLNVCQAVSYAHSKGIIHRDLKAENIIVGKFGEVLILDWGIAIYKGEKENLSLEEEKSSSFFPDLTQPGKILGTLSYLAPERAEGKEASESTDIYSLGVMLYLLLTLDLPFSRGNLKKFKKIMYYEQLIEPTEKAPYREIPRQLSEITKKSLSFDPKDRYDSVKSLINDLEHYIEGNPEWIFAKSLSLENKEDWEFQENILLAKHMAITRSSKVMEWALLMISKQSFSGSTKIEIEITMHKGAQGLGILLSIPDPKEREGIQDGYRFWIGTEEKPAVKLYRSNVEVMHLTDIGLKKEAKQLLVIEKIENHVRLYLDHTLILNYVSYAPIVGAHVGLMYKDTFFTIDHFHVFEGSQSVMVNCLSVPDAFLATKNFDKALIEYQRIGYSFQGRAEGREALFRAGITWIEKAKQEKRESKKREYLVAAAEEFEKLRASPGAPLEYLGKSIVYQEEQEVEEEIKCLELALRKYPRHPLQHILEEHIIFRLHQTASRDRVGAYHFCLLSLRLIPHIFSLEDTKSLLQNLQNFKEDLFFIQKLESFSSLKAGYIHLAMELSFWLNKPLLLLEIYEKKLPSSPDKNVMVQNIILIFLALNMHDPAWNILDKELQPKTDESLELQNIIKIVQEPIAKWLDYFPEHPSAFLLRMFLVSAFHHLTVKDAKTVLPLFEKLQFLDMDKKLREYFDAFHIWALLLTNDVGPVTDIFEKYSIEELNDKPSLLFVMYGLYLWITEGKEISIIHFEALPDVSFPYTYELLSYYLRGKIKLKKGWGKKAFLWEKVSLCKQLALFYHITKEPAKVKYFEKKAKELLKKHKSNIYTN
ncbi:MAG: hypothetical protein Tsb0015_09300 [Simkaniaceae bacterium]